MTWLDIYVFQNNLKVAYPEIFFVTAIIIILLYGVIYNASQYYKYPILTMPVGWLSIQTLAIVVLLISQAPYEQHTILNGVLIVDDFTNLIKIIILLSSLSCILISLDYIKGQKVNVTEYTVLILISTLSSMLIVSSYDLISMYLAIELQSLAFYVLAASRRDNEFSTEAGLKYFILGALSSGLLLFGSAAIYGLTGATNFEELAKFLQPQSHQFCTILAMSFIFIAFLFKISAVPFHMWTPDVYEGAPTWITAFFTITPKIAILSLLLRLTLYTFYEFIDTWQYIIIISATLSIYIGTFGAIGQNKLKRLFAYSSIAHVGYLLIALGTGTIEAIESLFIYILVYIITAINVFAIILVTVKIYSPHQSGLHTSNIYRTVNYQNRQLPQFEGSPCVYMLVGSPGRNASVDSTTRYLKQSQPLWHNQDSTQTIRHINYLNRVGSKRECLSAKHISDLTALSTTNPILAATFSITLFSNSGVPPLAGFYGKLNVFLAAIENGSYFIALAGVICSVIGAFYSIRLIKVMYFSSTTCYPNSQFKQISRENSILLGITFLFTLFFFLDPSFLFILTHQVALTICL